MQLEDMSTAELIDLVKLQEAALKAEQARYESLAQAFPVARESVQVTAAELSCVINWLEGGRDPKDAAKELRLYRERAWTCTQSVQQPAPVFAFEDDKNFLHRLDLLLDTKYPVMRKDALARRISELANEFILAAPVAAPVAGQEPVGMFTRDMRGMVRQIHPDLVKLHSGNAPPGCFPLFAAHPANVAQVGHTCESCGTHEVELVKVCHNSSCAQYAVEKSVHKGWVKK